MELKELSQKHHCDNILGAEEDEDEESETDACPTCHDTTGHPCVCHTEPPPGMEWLLELSCDTDATDATTPRCSEAEAQPASPPAEAGPAPATPRTPRCGASIKLPNHPRPSTPDQEQSSDATSMNSSGTPDSSALSSLGSATPPAAPLLDVVQAVAFWEDVLSRVDRAPPGSTAVARHPLSTRYQRAFCLDQVPVECLSLVGEYLPMAEAGRFSEVSRRTFAAMSCDSLWRVYFHEVFSLGADSSACGFISLQKHCLVVQDLLCSGRMYVYGNGSGRPVPPYTSFPSELALQTTHSMPVESFRSAFLREKCAFNAAVRKARKESDFLCPVAKVGGWGADLGGCDSAARPPSRTSTRVAAAGSGEAPKKKGRLPNWRRLLSCFTGDSV